MKYVVTREGKHCQVYALVARDGTVFWKPTRRAATELSLERAKQVAEQSNAEIVCADCHGDCDNILDALKTALQEPAVC